MTFITSWRQAVVAALLLSSNAVLAGSARDRRLVNIQKRQDASFGGQQGAIPLGTAGTPGDAPVIAGGPPAMPRMLMS